MFILNPGIFFLSVRIPDFVSSDRFAWTGPLRLSFTDHVGYFTGDNVQYVLTEEEVQRETEAVENANSDDDYIFVNGRMIKNPAKTNTKE